MLEAARVPGSVAEAADLAALIPLLEAAGRLRAYGRAIAPVAPDLAAALAGFPPQKDLADLLARSIDADGQLRDDASPALRRVRGRIRDLRREIVKRLEAYFGAPGAEATFQERYVTVRHGRYVLPIRAEAKSRLRGIVHDRSQSGATLFVEPEGMVEANNDLVQAAREEETEILRILAALTDAVREALPDLDALVAGIGGLDLIFARGALAERMEAVEPAIDEAGDVSLPGARNPLLLAQAWRGAAEGEPSGSMAGRGAAEGEPSGSMAGRGAAEGEPSGSMAGRGAAEGEPSGSGTAGHSDGHRDPRGSPAARHHRPQRGRQDGRAQDPGPARPDGAGGLPRARARGGAAARLLPDLRHRGRRSERGGEPLDLLGVRQAAPRRAGARSTAARSCCSTSWARAPTPTTGPRWPRPSSRRSPSAARWWRPRRISSRCKGFASTHPRARNASVEFDPERLAPTFRLVYDRPGQSYALSIGARLGLPPALIERAHAPPLDPAAPAPGAARPPRRPRPAGRRAHRRARAPRGGERGAARRGPRPSWRRRGPPRARRWPAPRPRPSGSSPRCGGT